MINHLKTWRKWVLFNFEPKPYMTLLITQRCLDDWMFVFINQRSASGTCHSVSQTSLFSTSLIHCGLLCLFDGWFPGWLIVFWMTDEVEIWSSASASLRWWTEPILSLQAEYQIGLVSGFCHFILFPFSLSFFPLLIIFLMSHFHRLCLCARCWPLWLFLVNFPL